MSQTKVTINCSPDNTPEIQQWSLIPNELGVVEPDRISVEFGNMSYCIVLDKKNPRVEAWNLDDKTELKDIVAHFSLPKQR